MFNEGLINSERMFFIMNRITGDDILSVKKGIANADQEKSPIYIGIDSEGGPVLPVLHLGDALKFVQSPIVGVVAGRCMSAAVTLLQLCTLRLATPDSSFLIHSPSANLEIFGRFSNAELMKKVKREIMEMRMYEKRNRSIIMKRSGISEEVMSALVKEGDSIGTYHSSYEALSLGLIDAVVSNERDIVCIVHERLNF